MRFLECGDPQHGFARIYCDQCRHGYLLAFSCKARYFWMHKTLKRNYQIMPGADWLAQLCAHIPDRFEHLVREAARVRSTWARLIHKVYEVDPLECPKCKGPMRVIALIDDKAVIRKILRHLGLWVPQIAAGRGPGPPAPDPPGPAAQILTYHRVPDIA